MFQIEQVEKLPAEQYEKYGLGSEATPQDFFKAARAHGHGYSERREAWEGLAAAATFEADRLKQVRLIPIDLNGGGGGTPRFADKTRGKHIIENVAQWSQRFGTKVEYEQKEGVGSLAITRGR